MGEAKRRQDNLTEAQRLALAISHGLINNGKLIEGGFEAFRALVIPADVSQTQIDECRKAFFAGADHLYTSIMATMDEGDEITPADEKRMENIDNELEAFRKGFAFELTPTKGRA